MRKLKKVLKIVVIAFAALILLLIASTYLFRGKIVSIAKTEINKNINADVDFKTVNISFFRHFPRVSLGLDELQVTGKGAFAADTLLSAKRLDVAVDILSFIRGSEMNIYNVVLEVPRIHALMNKEGQANWDIMKADEHPADSATQSEPFHLQLKKYSIRDGYIYYDDRQSDMGAEIIGLNHEGKGDFTADIFTLFTHTTANEVTFMYGAIPFLKKVNAVLDADIQVDNTQDQYSFENLELTLNELRINGNGWLRMLSNGYDMDISFKAPDTDFKNILSLIPAIYQKDFDQITAKGSTRFEGRVKGIYSDASLPGYHVDMVIREGYFKYKDLPKAVEQIQLTAAVDNPDGQTDNLVVDVKKGHLQIDKDPFNFRLLLKKPLSSMFVDAAAKGKLDLSQVGHFVKLDEGTNLSGLLLADVAVKGNVNDLQQEQYGNFFAAGTVDLSRFRYVSADYPTGVAIHNVNTTFSPNHILVKNLSGEYLKTGFSGGGQIHNLLNYAFSGKPLRATLEVNADRVNLNDWMGVEEDTAASEKSSAFIVPANLDVTLHARVDEVKYDQLQINNLGGALRIEEEKVVLDQIHGNALDGKITIDGSYSTKENKQRPAIAMSYDVTDVDVQKTFYAFNTVQKLMPIGKFLAGKLSSSLSANGRLGEEMDVDMSTLSGKGNVLLIKGFLSKFAPLDKMATALHITALEQISLQDVKAFFEFSNGKMLVKPFTVRVKGIEMEIGGLQGFDQSMDYTVHLKVPRALMGPQANGLVNQLASSVAARGIPIQVGDMVNFTVDLTGSIQSPSVRVDLKETGESLAAQMKDQVQQFAQARLDSAKAAAKDTLSSIGKQLGNAAKEEITKQLFGRKDSLADSGAANKGAKEKTKESVKGLLNNLLRKKQQDTTGKE